MSTCPGPFTVRFTPSRHSKLVLGLKVPSDAELTCDARNDLAAGRYRCGRVWGITIEVAGVRIYHRGSADPVDDGIRDWGVDVFLCGIAGRAYTRRFVPRILAALNPKRLEVGRHGREPFPKNREARLRRFHRVRRTVVPRHRLVRSHR